MEFLRLVTAVIGRPNTRNSHRFGILFPLPWSWNARSNSRNIYYSIRLMDGEDVSYLFDILAHKIINVFHLRSSYGRISSRCSLVSMKIRIKFRKSEA